ncbi:MlaD family protein [Nocardioides sp.]|uniref:MlaD family protein n=1 Tax=Nocardioides sp. TaxID=35761 RepID=UPI00321B5C3F
MSDVDANGAKPLSRMITVVAFTLACAGIFGFLWVNSGGKVPVAGSNRYTVAVDLPRVANVVYFSDVMVAGIKVGKVTDVEERGDHARVVMELDETVAPVHDGASVQVRAKSLIEESFLEITDGEGAEVPNGGVLADGAGKAPTQLSDVLETLDEPTRTALTRSVRSLGKGVEGADPAISDAVEGLGYLGRNGLTVTDALAAQGEDLRSLTRSSTRVLAALTERRGQLSQLVGDSREVFEATAGQRADLEAFVRALPPVLTAADEGSDDLTRLGDALDPVAANLEAAAPDLTAALRALPATTRDLRAAVPSLSTVLDRAPRTLTRVPTFSARGRALLPDTQAVLSDLNPVLGYLQPYGRDVAAFFTNFAQTLGLGDVNGKAFRVMPPLNEQSYKGIPITTNIGPLDKFNPLPLPGSLDNLAPYGNRSYPRVERE